jgi:hypothetical protein
MIRLAYFLDFVVRGSLLELFSCFEDLGEEGRVSQAICFFGSQTVDRELHAVSDPSHDCAQSLRA